MINSKIRDSIKVQNLFHRDIFFPEDLLQASKQQHIKLVYSPNAREHSKHDAFPVRCGVTVTWSNILEVNSANYFKPSEAIQTVVISEPHDTDTDLVFTIDTDLRSGHGVVRSTVRKHARKPHYSARLSEYISS